MQRQNTRNSPHILIIRNGALGDTIVMSVVYQALRQQYPQAYLEAVGPPERLQLINTPGLLNKIRSPETGAFAALFTDDAAEMHNAAAAFRQVDLILVYSFDRDAVLTTRLRQLEGPQVYRFDPFPRPDSDVHVTTYLLRTLHTIGIEPPPLVPQIALPPQQLGKQGAEELCVGLHPGSGSPEKNWPAARFAEVAERLVQTWSARVVLFAGPAETEQLAAISRRIPAPTLRIAQNAPLPEVAEVLRQCHLYLGNDSGVSHLAAAVGVPTIAIFGPSNPRVWRPVGRQVIVLHTDRRPACVGVTVEQVWAAVNTLRLAIS